MSVHRRLRLLTFPTRTGAAAKAARPGTRFSWFPDTESLRTTLGASTTPDQRGARGDAPARFAFRSVNSVGVQNRRLSRLDGWPMRPYRRFEAALTDKPARLGFNAGDL